jgi:hydrocephalus-inducing protein
MVETLAEYMGIDLSPEAREAEKRLGIALVIHGPMNSGRTTQAKAIGAAYGAAVLKLDAVIIDAISSASTATGRKARELCIQALAAKSVDSETVTVPSQGTKKQAQVAVKEHPPAEVPSMPVLPLTPFIVEPHEDKEYAVTEKTLIPTQLPEDMLVEIFSERLQLEDCRRGIVVDGIESQFCSNSVVSVAVILRSLNNRKHIYFVNLNLELQIIKNRLNDIEQQRLMKMREEELKKREAERRESERIDKLLNLDEDEYEALTEEEQAEVDAICLQRKRYKREQRRMAKEQRERQERERKEEEERLKELEKSRKKGKNKQMQKLGQKTAAGIQPSRPESVSSGIFPQMSHASGFVGTSSRVSLASVMDSPTGGTTPRHRPVKRRPSAAAKTLATESEEDMARLDRFYGQYKLGLEGIKTLLEDWDRQKGIARPKKPPESEDAPKPTPTRKSRGFKQKEMDIAVTPEVEESREGLGVPFIDVQAEKSTANVSEQILSAGLPTLEDILLGMGIGPDGPPIPGSFTFQISPLSLKRKSQEPPSDVYSFIISSPDDP